MGFFKKSCSLFRFVLWCSLILVYTGCQSGGASLEVDAQPQPINIDVPSMTEIPGLADRMLSTPGFFNVDAKDFIGGQGYFKEEFQAYGLLSNGQYPSWVAFGWYGIDPAVSCPRVISADVTVNEGEFWVLLPDFSRGCWVPAGPFTEGNAVVEVFDVTENPIGHDGVFYVLVVTHGGSSAWVHGISVETFEQPLGPQASRWLEASYDDRADGIQLDWEPSLDGSTHKIYRWPAGKTEAQAVEVTTSADEYVDTQVDPGKNYYYRVSHHLDGLDSPKSPLALGRRTDTANPAAGHSIKGRFMFAHKFSEFSHFGEPGVELYLSIANLYTSTDRNGRFEFRHLESFAGDLFNVSQKPPVPVRSVNLEGQDLNLGALFVYPNTPISKDWYWLYPPYRPVVTPESDDSFNLEWQKVKLASYYEVYRSGSRDMSGAVLAATTQETSMLLADQPVGRHYYRIQAVDTGANGYTRRSAFSDAVAFQVDEGGIMPDRLYVVPEKTTAQPGEAVRVTVYCDRTANPFVFQNGVSLSFEEGNGYQANSFNIGEPGGNITDCDGVWADFGDVEFLLGSDAWLEPEPIGNGREFILVNITPLIQGVDELELATGAMFNLGIIVNTDITFGFHKVDIVKRTFYSDVASTEYFWSDLSNDGQPGIKLIK